MNNLPSDQINQARSSIEQAGNILISLKSNPLLDEVAAGLALYLALSAKGKRTNIVSASPMVVEYNKLVGIDKITSNFSSSTGGKNLIISFPYQEGSIEKVSYNIEGNSFNLVIEPREGYHQITPDVIRYSSNDGGADLVITVGAHSLSDLDGIYQNNQNLFSEKTVINIDADNRNQRFGKINLVDSNASSLSELVISLFTMLNLNLDSDIASNLYSGIISATNNFTSNQTNANTFEAVAICLKNGAKKPNSNIPNYSVPPPKQLHANPPSSSPYQNVKNPFIPQPNNTSYQKQNFGNQTPPRNNQQKTQQQDTPPDWLKPKIYKGSTLL